jgi:hypothetical protein
MVCAGCLFSNLGAELFRQPGHPERSRGADSQALQLVLKQACAEHWLRGRRGGRGEQRRGHTRNRTGDWETFCSCSAQLVSGFLGLKSICPGLAPEESESGTAGPALPHLRGPPLWLRRGGLRLLPRCAPCLLMKCKGRGWCASCKPSGICCAPPPDASATRAALAALHWI